jgi:hypothetical protein
MIIRFLSWRGWIAVLCVCGFVGWAVYLSVPR